MGDSLLCVIWLNAFILQWCFYHFISELANKITHKALLIVSWLETFVAIFFPCIDLCFTFLLTPLVFFPYNLDPIFLFFFSCHSTCLTGIFYFYLFFHFKNTCAFLQTRKPSCSLPNRCIVMWGKEKIKFLFPYSQRGINITLKPFIFPLPC